MNSFDGFAQFLPSVLLKVLRELRLIWSRQHNSNIISNWIDVYYAAAVKQLDYHRHHHMARLGCSIAPCSCLIALRHRSAGEMQESSRICSSELLCGQPGLRLHEWWGVYECSRHTPWTGYFIRNVQFLFVTPDWILSIADMRFIEMKMWEWFVSPPPLLSHCPSFSHVLFPIPSLPSPPSCQNTAGVLLPACNAF